jgi:long-chain acyl-CoA synthetase
MKYLVEIEPAIPAHGDKPSVGPTYRNVTAKDGFKAVPENINSCWDLFRWVPCFFFIQFSPWEVSFF